MVQVCLNQEQYIPGDELRITASLSKTEAVQLLSVRCYGYLRLPTSVVKDIPERTKYAFLRDKPGVPLIPDDSVLLWLTPNFPVHFDFFHESDGLVKLFVPYFLPPSIKGGLFEICHYVEVSILMRGEFDMRTKRLPLIIASVEEMPKYLSPAIGDGYEQFDFSVAPSLQCTPHGRRASGCEAVDLVTNKINRHSISGFFRSWRHFRISFNNQHAVEISIHGEWSGDRLIVQEGSQVYPQFRFDHSNVSVQRVGCQLIRKEKIHVKEDQWLETPVFHTNSVTVNPYLSETSLAVSFPVQLCPSFRADLVEVSYEINFELRAIDATTGSVLEIVHWSLPVLVQSSDCEPPLAALPFTPLTSDAKQTIHDAEIFQVRQRSHIQPGSMRFTIYS